MQTKMVCALAGRRVDAPGAPPRFPLGQVDVVRERLRKLMIDREVTMLVASAACGADLVALDVARDLGVRRRILLPFAAGEFRDTSVVDRPGDWGPSYDRQIGDAQRTGDLVVLDPGPNRDQSYLLANEAILNEAAALAADPLRALAIIAWEGQPRGPDDATHQFAEAARARGFEVAEVLTR